MGVVTFESAEARSAAMKQFPKGPQGRDIVKTLWGTMSNDTRLDTLKWLKATWGGIAGVTSPAPMVYISDTHLIDLVQGDSMLYSRLKDSPYTPLFAWGKKLEDADVVSAHRRHEARGYHDEQRDAMSHTFSPANMATIAKDVHNYIDGYMEAWGRHVDLAHVCGQLTWNIAIEWLVGVNLSFDLQKDVDDHLDMATSRSAAMCSFIPFLDRFPFSLFPWSREYRRLKKLNAKLRKTYTDIYDKVKSGNVDFPGALVELMIAMSENPEAFAKGFAFTAGQIKANIATFFNAGQDTTTYLFLRALIVLSERPDIFAWLWEEIKEYVANKHNVPLHEAYLKMPRLNAFWQEMLRVHGSVIAQYRIAMEDSYLGDHFIPKGTTIMLVQALANVDPTVWGKDAEEFRPQRHIEAKKAGIKLPKIMAFSGGVHYCLGAFLAELEFKLSIITFVTRFSGIAAQPEFTTFEATTRRIPECEAELTLRQQAS